MPNIIIMSWIAKEKKKKKRRGTIIKFFVFFRVYNKETEKRRCGFFFWTKGKLFNLYIKKCLFEIILYRIK